MRKSIITVSLLGAVLGLASVAAEAAPRGPATFYDQNGGFRGYLWCLKSGMEIFSVKLASLRLDRNPFLPPHRDEFQTSRERYRQENPSCHSDIFN